MNARDLVTLGLFPTVRPIMRRARRAGLSTLLDYQRLAALQGAARIALGVAGDVVEFGSYRGGSAALLGEAIRGTGRALVLCDSFAGLPAPGARDNYHTKGDFSDTSAENVARGLEQLGIKAELRVGLFKDTLARPVGPLCFAHVDVDLYESVLQCLRFCYPFLSPGGVIVLDDYSAPTCLGARAAADEFCAATGEVIAPLSHPSAAVWVGRKSRSLRGEILRRSSIGALGTLAGAVFRD